MSAADDFDAMYALATQKGEELKELAKKNDKRKKKGLPKLLDPQEKADLAVRRRRYRTNDATTVDAAEALKLFHMRKEQMEDASDVEEDEEVVQPKSSTDKKVVHKEPQEQVSDDAATERAIREAESVRRVEDAKNGRINHLGVWSGDGNKVEGGDNTNLSPSVPAAEEEAAKPAKPAPKTKGKSASVSHDELNAFKNDLYERLKISFEELEKSLSDIQGRVAEIVTASTPAQHEDELTTEGKFDALLKGTTPITFNVNGTKMTCSAVKVFYNSPCITILSKIGSATIQPEAGARIRLSYEANGHKYEDDPVTFVGLRVDLEELGFSLVGFVRDNETDLVEVPSGV